MDKKYLAKIIAKDSQGLKLISACCFKAKVKIEELKYLKKNKIFFLSLKRLSVETENKNLSINSILKFDFVNSLKSININQNNKDLNLKLLAIDLLKNKDKFEINLIFNNNSCITLSTEIVEVTLEDQNKI